ncbi:MAG TPA: serine hydroxymethyltransferase, partial [Synergistaceae bacterium]|nr:serine hydroxymethyltransferase [Synergistaceae bacterium]
TTMAAKAWSLKYMQSEAFRTIMAQVLVNARTLAEALAKHGFRIVSGGTDNHIVMADLRPKNISGTVFQNALDSVGITVNKNQIPNDPASPFVTSGVRIGLTSTSQRGLKEPEIRRIARIMSDVADSPDDAAVLDKLRSEARELIAAFPLYPPHTFDD